jgi:hypothetical protein
MNILACNACGTPCPLRDHIFFGLLSSADSSQESSALSSASSVSSLGTSPSGPPPFSSPDSLEAVLPALSASQFPPLPPAQLPTSLPVDRPPSASIPPPASCPTRNTSWTQCLASWPHLYCWLLSKQYTSQSVTTPPSHHGCAL